MSTEPSSQQSPQAPSQPASAPQAPTTQTAVPTQSPATTDQGWTPYKPDPSLSAAENLTRKGEYDKNAPAGHDPNQPLAPKTTEAPKPPAQTQELPLVTMEALKAPEGMEIDPAFATEFTGLINQFRGEPAKLAQELINLQGRLMAAAQEADSKRWDSVQTDWKKQSEADPEIGGAKYAKTTADTKAIMDRFGGPKTLEALELTGFGNHPEFHRMMAKIAPFVLEAGPIPPPAPQTPTNQRSTTNLYPQQGK